MTNDRAPSYENRPALFNQLLVAELLVECLIGERGVACELLVECLRAGGAGELLVLGRGPSVIIPSSCLFICRITV